MKNLISPQRDSSLITKSCRNCTREAIYNNFCKYCWSQYTKKYRVKGKYIKQPPKLMKLIGKEEIITTYEIAAATAGITKNYLYVAMHKGLKVNGYKFEKC